MDENRKVRIEEQVLPPKRGFSLIELIIAIAILVILTGLLAPQFIKYIERSRYAACMHDMDVLAQEYQVEVMADSGRSDMSAIQELNQIIVNHGGSPKDEYDMYGYYTGICKSGGEYQCELWGDLGGIGIQCSRHGELELDIVTLKNRLESIEINVEGFRYKTLAQYFENQKELDSEAKGTDTEDNYGSYRSFAAAVSEQLNKQGIYVKNKSWKMYRDGSRYELYLSAQKIKEEDNGNWVECKKYDINGKAIINGKAQVELKTIVVDGKASTFPVIKMSSFEKTE